ncbi:MAG: phosphoribosyl-ATP diphosphatase [Rickettsiales bacterium]|jgi:phosphoribosyl-ATP pyrophosphohydrolase|nr:phosphoribosyl-ATP diphosphatase [Rickettsiales bacterium]
MSTSDTLERLYKVVESRRGGDPDTSYVAKRLRQGTAKISQKLGEEAVETVIAAMRGDKKEIINESADLIFHWLLLLVDQGITLEEVMAEMTRREGTSGHVEKKRRRGDL